MKTNTWAGVDFWFWVNLGFWNGFFRLGIGLSQSLKYFIDVLGLKNMLKIDFG